MNQSHHNEQDLLKKHRPLVAAIAHQFASVRPNFFSAEHLHGLGLIALLAAARQFPQSSRLSFEAFASIRIHDLLLGELRRGQQWFQSAPHNSNPTSARV